MRKVNPEFKGDIQRGTVVYQPLNSSFGVITDTKGCNTNGSTSSNVVGGILVTASREGGSVDVVYPSGEKTDCFPESILRKYNQLVTVTLENIEEIRNSGIEIDEETMLAKESCIAELEKKAIEFAETQNQAEEKKHREFNEAVEAILASDEYKHLAKMSQDSIQWSTDVAKNVRKDLKKQFPNGKFSVRKGCLTSLYVTIKGGSAERSEVVSFLSKYHQSEQTPFMKAFGTLDVISVETE